MADDPVADYQAALQEFEASVGRVQEMVTNIRGVSNKLNSWKESSVADGTTKFPTNLDDRKAINPREWPSLSELAQTLSAYHAALREVGNAYQKIPDNQREAVKLPPDC